MKALNYLIYKFNIFKTHIKRYSLKKLRVCSERETLKLILNNQLSVSRFGDGELDLIRGKSLKFQAYDEDLAKKLETILFTDTQNHLVCLPNIFSKLNQFKPGSKSFALETVNDNFNLFKKLDINRVYGSAYITRFYMAYNPNFVDFKYPDVIKLIWQYKNILMVEGTQSRLGIGNDLFDNANKIRRIICPSTNAYSFYDEILEEVKRSHNGDLVLLALGPTATVLAYDLEGFGIQSIDVGHVDIEYSWMIARAEKKIDIKAKHVNEVSGIIADDDFRCSQYEKEIIMRVHC